MTVYLGDLIDGGTHDFKFTTVKSTGAPTVLAGTPVLSIYKDNSVTQTTAGITLTVDFDSVVGLNHVRLVLTDAFYVADTDYQVVITTGTVDSVSVVGYVVAQFSISNRMPNVNLVEIGDSAQSATDLKDFADAGYDPATNKVTGVVLVDTTTTNTDVRGTDNVVTAGPTKAEMDTAHALLATPAQVNTEVLDVLVTDTFAEPAQGAPGDTISIEEKISFIYAALINLVDVDATLKEFYNAAGTVIWKKTVADDGTNYNEAKGATGP